MRGFSETNEAQEFCDTVLDVDDKIAFGQLAEINRSTMTFYAAEVPSRMSGEPAK